MDVRAFRGWRYRPQQGRDVGAFLAPPYDILTAEDKQALLAGCENNIVAVDLPHVPPENAGPDDVYAQAAALLKRRQDGGLIVRDQMPCIYVYEQTCTWAGRARTRRALICAVRATGLGRDVIPHEHTFPGPCADRLKLTEHTRMQLSPILGFHNDPGGQVRGLLDPLAAAEPDAEGTLNDVVEKLWAVGDPDAIGRITEALRDVPVYIADGHHRYTTALNYAGALRETQGIGPDHASNFVMFALVARDDPGLLVLPAHRIIRGLKDGFALSKLREALGETFDWRKIHDPGADLADADAFLRPYGPGTMAVLAGEETWTARLVDGGAMAAAAPNQCDAWRALDVAVLHELIISGPLASWRTDEFAVEYTPDGAAARRAVRAGGAQIAFCLQGTPLQSVIDVADAGASMPHKSTYFFPKVATGMVLKPLE